MDAATPDKAPLLDVTRFGYFKVLGKGVLPSSKPIVVKAKAHIEDCGEEDQRSWRCRRAYRLGYVFDLFSHYLDLIYWISIRMLLKLNILYDDIDLEFESDVLDRFFVLIRDECVVDQQSRANPSLVFP